MHQRSKRGGESEIGVANVDGYLAPSAFTNLTMSAASSSNTSAHEFRQNARGEPDTVTPPRGFLTGDRRPSFAPQSSGFIANTAPETRSCFSAHDAFSILVLTVSSSTADSVAFRNRKSGNFFPGGGVSWLLLQVLNFELTSLHSFPFHGANHR